MRGKRGGSERWGQQRRPGKRRWSRPLGTISAATAPAGFKWPCAKTGTEWGRQRLRTGRATRACTHSSPALTPRTTNSPTGCAASPTGYLTSPSPPRSIESRSRTSRFTAGEQRVDLSMRLPEQVHQARHGLARVGNHAGSIGHFGLAAGLFCPTAYPKPHRPL